MLAQRLEELVRAAFSGIWICTSEPDEAAREIGELAHTHNWHMVEWDLDRSSQDLDPLSALRLSRSANENTLIVLHNFHKLLQDAMMIQACFNAIIKGKERRVFIIVLACTIAIPPELQKHFVVVDHELPDPVQLNTIANDFSEDQSEETGKAVCAARGLTRYEAEGAFALSMVRHKRLYAETVWEIKCSAIAKSGLLSIHKGKENFNDLGGMSGIKDFTSRAIAGTGSRGALLLGVPGTGKSAFAKALGTETARPTVLLDIGGLMGSLVGETESNLRGALKQVDAIAPCVLFIDEIEKALAGSTSSHQGDNGVSARMLGTLLTWMQDHTSEVFTIVTCNDASKLPIEFMRAERFDASFFIDLPTREQKDSIWPIYRKQYKIPIGDFLQPDDDDWTGAEIKSCCRLSRLLGEQLTQAAKRVIPIARTAQDRISALKQWADGRCLDAETGEVYRQNKQPAKRRKVST